MKSFKQFLSFLTSLILLVSMSNTAMAAAAPMSQKEINALKRTSDWHTDKEVATCSAGDTGSTIPLEGSDDAEKVWNYLTAPGRLKPFQAAGIMGNMQHESGIQPQRLQNTASGVKTPAEAVGSRNTGWGLVQWTPASKFISKQSPISKANDVGIQIDFLWQQLNGGTDIPEARAGTELKNTTSIEQAVLAFQGGPAQTIGSQTVGPYYGYERPQNKTGSIPQRYSAAKGYLARYGSGAGSSIPVSGTADVTTVAVSSCGTAAGGVAAGPVDLATVFQASDTLACPVGVDGGVQDGYNDGTLVKVRICKVPTGVANATVSVNARIAKQVADLFAAAKAQGVVMSGGGFRTMADQQRTYNTNCRGGGCSPPTAKPGYSNHQMGLAIDFTLNSSILRVNDAGNTWLKANAANFSLKNLPSEAWHWSVDGG